MGSAVQFDASGDVYASFSSDPDYTVTGDMFGIRSRINQGIPSLPFDIVDDSFSIFPGDVQGIIGEFDSAFLRRGGYGQRRGQQHGYGDMDV